MDFNSHFAKIDTISFKVKVIEKIHLFAHAIKTIFYFDTTNYIK